MSKLEKLIQELCPDGVDFSPIKDICSITRGRVMSKDYIAANAGDYPVYSSQTNNNGELGRISTFDFGGSFVTWTTDGANAGTIFYREGNFSITNVCGLLKADNSKILTKFLYYALSVTAHSYVNEGMGNPKLMSNVMAEIVIPVPPLEVQSEIVRILDSFTELTEELTAELTARKQQYEAYRSVLLGSFTGVPMKTLGETCVMKAGKAIPSAMISPVCSDEYRVKCFGGNGIRGFVAEPNQNGEYPLIGRQGALCGNVNYATDSFYATEHAVVVKSKGEYTQRFLYHLLTHMNLNQYKSAGAQPGLSVSNLEKLLAPVPSIPDQERIVKLLDIFDSLCTSITAGLPAEIEARQKQYEYYRDKLLTFKRKEA